MARNFGGTTGDKIQFANSSAINITGTALSIFCRFRKADTGTRRYLFGKSGAGATPFAYGMRVDANNQIVFLVDGGAGVYDNAASTTTVSANTWYTALGVKNGTGGGAISVYVNGSQEGSSVSNVTLASNTNDLVAGYRDISATSEIWSGDIAELAIWNVALTAAEAVALDKGISPALIRPQSLQYYAPLLGRASPEQDLRGGNGGTVTGTSAADHPRILRSTRGQVGIRPRRAGDAGITQAGDTLSSAGTVATGGAASVTQAADTVSAAGAVAIAADASVTQAADTVSAAGVVSASDITGAADITQGADTVSAAGTVAISAAASISQAADTLSAAGTLPIAGDASISQAADTTSAAGSVALVGAASITQGADTLSAAGGAPALLGDAALTQAGDTVAAAGTVATFGAAAITQGADTSTAAGAVAIVGAASISQAADTVSAAGALGLLFRPWTRNRLTVPAEDYTAITQLSTRLTVPAESLASEA